MVIKVLKAFLAVEGAAFHTVYKVFSVVVLSGGTANKTFCGGGVDKVAEDGAPVD